MPILFHGLGRPPTISSSTSSLQPVRSACRCTIYHTFEDCRVEYTIGLFLSSGRKTTKRNRRIVASDARLVLWCSKDAAMGLLKLTAIGLRIALPDRLKIPNQVSTLLL